MTRSTFNNSGFQARALLDLTFIQHQLKVCTYIELYNMQTILQAATATQTDTNNLQKRKNNFSVDVSVWRWLTMCPADESMVGKNVWSVSKSLQRIDPLCLPVEWQVCTAHPLGQSSAKHNHSRVLNSIRLFIIWNTLPMSLSTTQLSVLNATMRAEIRSKLLWISVKTEQERWWNPWVAVAKAKKDSNLKHLFRLHGFRQNVGILEHLLKPVILMLIPKNECRSNQQCHWVVSLAGVVLILNYSRVGL